MMRRYSLYTCGVIGFTHRPPPCAHQAAPTAHTASLNRPFETPLAAGYQPELVQRGDIGERSGDRAKASVVARIDNPVLAPVPAAADQFELATGVRMKGVSDANLEAGRTHTTCSRRHSPRRRLR